MTLTIALRSYRSVVTKWKSRFVGTRYVIQKISANQFHPRHQCSIAFGKLKSKIVIQHFLFEIQKISENQYHPRHQCTIAFGKLKSAVRASPAPTMNYQMTTNDYYCCALLLPLCASIQYRASNDNTRR